MPGISDSMLPLPFTGMRDAIIEDIKQQDGVVLSGDPRMDSLGFSATKATYSFMEQQDSHSHQYGAWR